MTIQKSKNLTQTLARVAFHGSLIVGGILWAVIGYTA
jgi:hypothetical protein